MKTAPTPLYHISPSSNRNSIQRYGLDPFRSETKRYAVYCVDVSIMPWAIAHTSARHDVSVRKLDVWRVENTSHFRCLHRDIWYTYMPVEAQLDRSILLWVSEEYLLNVP